MLSLDLIISTKRIRGKTLVSWSTYWLDYDMNTI